MFLLILIALVLIIVAVAWGPRGLYTLIGGAILLVGGFYLLGLIRQSLGEDAAMGLVFTVLMLLALIAGLNRGKVRP